MNQSHIKRGPSGGPDLVPVADQKSSRSGGYARIPRSVITDTTLTAEARVVFGVLALEDQIIAGASNTVSVGSRLIAQMTGFDKKTVLKALKDLAKRRHIGLSRGEKQRGLIVLTSPVFAVKSAEHHEAPFTNRKLLSAWKGKTA